MTATQTLEAPHKADWSKQQHETYRDAITGMRVALDALVSAAIQLNRALVMKRFVKQFPTYSLNGRTVDSPGGYDVKFNSRDSKNFAEVLGAIDGLIGRLEDPPAPPEPPRLPLNVKKGQTWLPVTRA